MATERVLIYSQAFFPDHSGIPIYSSDFAFYCSENGYDVDVITGFPFYPQWEKRKEDKGKLFAKETVKGISIYRGYLYVAKNPTSFQRILHELTLVLFALLNSFRVKRPDIIVVFTTPVLLGVIAAFMNLFWKRKLVINVQDFQVEAAYSLGMLKGSTVLHIINKIEIWSYKQAHHVSSISNSMTQLLIDRKKIDHTKVILWPNWLHVKESKSDFPEKGLFRQKFGISQDSFLVAYAGNIGKKQGLEILVDIATKFSVRPDLLFLIIGEGSGLESLKAYAAKLGVENVLFLPFLNAQEYKEYLVDVDAIFISQMKIPFDVYFPSKLLGIMSVGQLLIISADQNSELYKVMKKNNLALVADYDDTDTLKEHIDTAIGNCSKVKEYKTESVKFIDQYDRELVLSNFLKSLKNLSQN
ncbi:glycosyltransferase family 4 protein [Spirosoma flavum]|uniref:Glycosyltransferase family 4 protein n=1 Tax=Spirosoma flavum TaxID=2048557 RepID=A0ABW6AKB1_9BACT